MTSEIMNLIINSVREAHLHTSEDIYQICKCKVLHGTIIIIVMLRRPCFAVAAIELCRQIFRRLRLLWRGCNGSRLVVKG